MSVPPVLPQRIRADSAVRRRQRVEGILGLEQLSRLRELTGEDPGSIRVEFQAACDADARRRLRGRIEGQLRLRCQRCAADFDWPVDIAVDWLLVDSEAEEQKLLGEAEPVLVEDDWLPLRQLVEDEVLLAVPMFPRCPDGDCR